jgi:hypothetical protein
MSAYLSWRRSWFRLKVDLIVVTGEPPALVAKKATTTVPIVMARALGGARSLGSGLSLYFSRSAPGQTSINSTALPGSRETLTGSILDLEETAWSRPTFNIYRR